MIYKGARTKEISFPLGGIGSGCIGLAGNGRLIDWEIFNKPDKGSVNGFSHFSIKAEAGGKLLDARMLNGDLFPPFSSHEGVPRAFMTGFPHFRSAEFRGEYPFASIGFNDAKFPGKVKMTAFNPLIPLNDRDSSIPAAFFCFELKNSTKKPVVYTLVSVLKNPFKEKTVNAFEKTGKIKLIKLSSFGFKETDIEYGDISVATDAEDCSYQEYWYRGGWFDNVIMYRNDLFKSGKFSNRAYSREQTAEAKKINDHCLLAARLELKPGETGSVRFIISWNFPNCHNYWKPEEKCSCGEECRPATWKNYYAGLFRDSKESAVYSLENWQKLYSGTEQFRSAFFSSTLPKPVLDAVSANISTLKSPTVMRLEDGSFYGFEGCNDKAGCCEGSCTHVWNYAYAMPFLFPSLERSLRETEYKYNMREDGNIGFRHQLPPGRPSVDWHACADGQFGGVIKTYRDWKICGDDAWLRSIWGQVKKAVEFAWSPTNEDKWDLDKDGVLEGRQHHTLDTELFGPNAYLTGFYLAALKAVSEMARYLGEAGKAEEYGELFRKGSGWVNKNLFNGDYFYQKIDVKDRRILDNYKDSDAKFGSIVDNYWNSEHNEIKHQLSEGCHIDQVIAQWHANISGLGEILEKEKVRKALGSIFRNNFKKSLRDFVNPCRVYAHNDESAIVICDWPEGKAKPAVPLTYAEEAMNGFEYQVAAHMIQEGLVKQGLEIVKGVRDRYDGEKRNPWDEFECGHNYARSMASYSLLLALSGFEFDMVRKHIGFNPAVSKKNFRCFWSVGCAWGTYARKGGRIIISVLHGLLELKTYSDSLLAGRGMPEIRGVGFSKSGATLMFEKTIVVQPGKDFIIKLK